jgi:hypothetical protein
VEELTKVVLESGLLEEREGELVLAGPLPPFAVPATLHDSLMARLDRLASVREVAQVGAVIGREFKHELLAAVAGLPDFQLERATSGDLAVLTLLINILQHTASGFGLRFLPVHQCSSVKNGRLASLAINYCPCAGGILNALEPFICGFHAESTPSRRMWFHEARADHRQRAVLGAGEALGDLEKMTAARPKSARTPW